MQRFEITSPLHSYLHLSLSLSLKTINPSMGRPPCCDKSNVKRGLWTPEEDAKILAYVSNHGVGNWTLVPKKAGFIWHSLFGFSFNISSFVRLIYIVWSWIYVCMSLCTGLNRCGKSCRLRWTNYLRSDLKHDGFTPQEEELIINLHKAIGSRWVFKYICDSYFYLFLVNSLS